MSDENTFYTNQYHAEQDENERLQKMFRKKARNILIDNYYMEVESGEINKDDVDLEDYIDERIDELVYLLAEDAGHD